MVKVKIIDAVSRIGLENEVNEFLTTIKSEEVRKTEYDLPNFTALIEYEIEEAWKKMMCADCQHWDDTGSADAVIGVCQECGGRKRFNCSACERFKDVRR